MSVSGGRRRGTSTSSFGVSRREAHDASAFYERFPAPEISDEDQIKPQASSDRLWVGDARDIDAHGEVADDSVALVVTSPPYYAGKQYEQAVGEGHVPASYVDYLKMLEDVFRECVRKLEPGGRIAVNVANLGRRPYRSLSADVIEILQDRLRLLLRGEVIWLKAKGAAGNCAWGSFQRPANPVLRDLTERVVIASKGRFDRARSAAARASEDLPSDGSSHVDEFMEATVDVWDIPPASATRVGHPAPFPVELPQRLIELYTYRGDLVLDPFMGAGTTAVAAVRTGRGYIGFDTDHSYIALAEQRIDDERRRLAEQADEQSWAVTVPPSAKRVSEQQFFADLDDPTISSPDGASQRSVTTEDSSDTSRSAVVEGGAVGAGEMAGGDAGAGDMLRDRDSLHRRLVDIGGGDAGAGGGNGGDNFEDFQARAGREGRKAQDMAEALLRRCGFRGIETKVKKRCGVEVNFEAFDQAGRKWFFDVSGAFSVTQRPGLRRTDTLWKALGKAAVLHSTEPGIPLVLLTTDSPSPNSAGRRALDSLTGPDKPVRAVIRMLDPDDRKALAEFARGDPQRPSEDSQKPNEQ